MTMILIVDIIMPEEEKGVFRDHFLNPLDVNDDTLVSD
jgi:hypothetical protein